MRVGLLMILLATSIALTGCRGRNASLPPDDTLRTDSIVVVENLFRQRVDSLVTSLTAEEQAGQILMPGVYAKADAATLALVKRYVENMHVGGIVLLKGTTAEARILCDSIRRWSKLPPLIAIDAEWGLGMRLTDAPSYIANSKLGDVTTAQMYDYGYEVGRQAQEIGINIVLGPVADVTDGSGGYMDFRAFQGDAARVAELAIAYARGLEDHGVLSCAKHFPGHGSAKGDSHKSRPVIAKTSAALEAVDLLPFRDYIASDLSCIMVGHLAVPALDSTSTPASCSRAVITELLRKRMHFRGLILTDALSMEGAGRQSAADAIRAGADIVLAPADTKKELIELSKYPDLLQSPVRRILTMKLQMQ